MKRVILSMAAVLAAAAGLWGASPATTNYVTRDFTDLDPFTGINLTGIVQVELVKGDNYSVSVTLPEDVQEYLKVKVSRDELSIGMDLVPAVRRRKLESWTVKAVVTMPELRSIEMSGTTKFNCEDSFDIGDNEFEVELSGTSKVNGLHVKARKIDVEMGGASEFSVVGLFEEAKLDVGGAGKCYFNADAAVLKADVSSASKTWMKGNYDDANIDVTAASMASIEGSVTNIKVEGSGASKIELKDAEIENAKMFLSGATYCEANVLKSLTVEASGGASLKYVDNEGLDLRITSQGRGASVVKL